jgi:regulator of protease activity HflC (stomatin/prohibitin superfamily)
MQSYLNRQMERYGVRILGANIPDVQLPDQYRENLATRERVAKELAAYEKEWELTRKRRTDTILMEIERSKKERDEKIIAVRESLNKAREEVAQMLQEREAEAEKIRLDIEAKGRANLKSAENEARALVSLGKSYRDNQAVLHYELEMRGLQVGEELLQHAPRPILVNSRGEGDSALSTLLLAQILPKLMQQQGDGDQPVDVSAAKSIIASLGEED